MPADENQNQLIVSKQARKRRLHEKSHYAEQGLQTGADIDVQFKP